MKNLIVFISVFCVLSLSGCKQIYSGIRDSGNYPNDMNGKWIDDDHDTQTFLRYRAATNTLAFCSVSGLSIQGYFRSYSDCNPITHRSVEGIFCNYTNGHPNVRVQQLNSIQNQLLVYENWRPDPMFFDGVSQAEVDSWFAQYCPSF